MGASTQNEGVATTTGAEALCASLALFVAEFDGRFSEALAEDDLIPPRLAEAMRYSALAPGKRLRPFLLVRACEVVGGGRENAWSAAMAVECVHAFSLIHDDLPAMDNDDYRRGRLTSHRQFDEATALLAGDGLLAWAFGMLAASPLPAARVVRLVRELSDATGPAGMIGGQMLDIEGERLPPQLEKVRQIHAMKTARLFEASARMGAICADAEPLHEEALARFGRALGLVFQIADDLLDITSTREELGKTTGKDQRSGKQAFPRCAGVSSSLIEAGTLADAAVRRMDVFGPEADDLRALPGLVLSRRH